MKSFSQYLAEYLEHENVCVMYYGETGDVEDLQELIVEGIDAYESIENCSLIIEHDGGQYSLRK